MTDGSLECMESAVGCCCYLPQDVAKKAQQQQQSDDCQEDYPPRNFGQKFSFSFKEYGQLNLQNRKDIVI